MEVTEYTQNRIVLEDNPWLERALMMVAGAGGIILVLSTMNQYGIQSSYRFTFQIGTLFGVLGILSFLFLGHRSKAIVNIPEQTFEIIFKKGIFTPNHIRIPLPQITDVRLDRQSIKGQDRYRISVQVDHAEWIPLSTRFGKDLRSYEVAGKKLQALIMMQKNL